MRTLSQIFMKLCKYNRKNYYLIVGCFFLSVLLITSFVSMMQSPTVLTVFPEGGDSRKMVMAVFVLAIVGCGAFSVYASSLFFRYKSREIGIFKALGASKRVISRQILKEITIITLFSCGAGMLLGVPLSIGIWKLFQIFIANTTEMKMQFDPKAYVSAGIFSVFIIVSLFIIAIYYINRTNIMEIVNEQRRNEPIRDIKPWYGIVGIGLIVVGGMGGFFSPQIYMYMFKQYPPMWLNLSYLPLFIGIYMLLLHAVIRGFRRRKNFYKNLITHSMMKFQGRQTVHNMLVITLLLAGAYFASFYTPMSYLPSIMEVNKRTVDYVWHYRQDQNMLTKEEVNQIALNENTKVIEWKQTDFANLGVDGTRQIEDDDKGRYHYEYAVLLEEKNYLSESSFIKMTGQQIDIKQGFYGAAMKTDASGGYMVSNDITQLTNMFTRETLKTAFQEYLYDDLMADGFSGYYVLDDKDYELITKGLTSEWKENLVYFNVEQGTDSYEFAYNLYISIISRFGKECEVARYYDRVKKIASNEAGEEYWGDTDAATKLSFSQPDSTEFRSYFKYMPKFRILDKSDSLKTFSVFLLLFVYIAIICFAAVLVIAYTRSITIAINNRQVYNDLKRLGANNKYLSYSIKGQLTKIYLIPAIVGTTVIFLLNCMILFFNDGMYTPNELVTILVCFLIIVLFSIILWGFYRFTLKRICAMLGIVKELPL